jgi:prefoldin subunit 5
MNDNIFAYDEEEILQDSLKALSRTFDAINNTTRDIDITSDAISSLDNKEIYDL